MLLPLLGVVAAVAIVGFFVWENHDMARTLIEGELKERRATNIAIQADWLDFDRDTLTYEVAYSDATGRRVSTRAKVAIGPFADRNVFWQQPLP